MTLIINFNRLVQTVLLEKKVLTDISRLNLFLNKCNLPSVNV